MKLSSTCLALVLALAAVGSEAVEVCVGKAFNQEAAWVGKQKRFRGFVSDLAGCTSLNVSKLYWKGSCTDRENNFGNSQPSCGSKDRVTDASGETCKQVFAQGGADDFVQVTQTGKNFDVGLICNPATGNSARSQDVFVFIKTSCSSIAKVAVGFDEDKTDSCPANAGSYSTRSDKSSYYNDPNEKEHRGIFEKISRAVFGVIIAICICLLLCCAGVAFLMVLRKRRAAKANAQPGGAQMQSGYGGGPGGPGGYGQQPGGYAQQPGGYGNQNQGYNQQAGYGQQPGGYAAKEAQYEGKPAGYPGGAAPATGHPVQGQPGGYPAV